MLAYTTEYIFYIAKFTMRKDYMSLSRILILSIQKSAFVKICNFLISKNDFNLKHILGKHNVVVNALLNNVLSNNRSFEELLFNIFDKNGDDEKNTVEEFTVESVPDRNFICKKFGAVNTSYYLTAPSKINEFPYSLRIVPRF